jgi:multidrug efflux pump subunit AcrA (membrane-fusion protein)
MPRPSRARSLLTPINVALGAVAVGGVVAAIVVVGPEEASSTTSERIVTVTKGVVQSTVSGSGNLSPANTMNLSFGTSGKVTKVYVKPGEHVTQGQLLARIDPTSAEVNLAEAKANLQSAQDTLDDIESGTTTTASASTATATATAAQAKGSSSTSTPSSTTTPSTTAPSGSGSGTAGSGAPGTGGSAESGTVGASGGDSAGSGSRSGSGAVSGGGSGAAGGGDSAVSEAAAEAAVKSAQLAVDNAEEALEATALRAPGAATVAEVNGAVGDQVGGGSSGGSSSSSSSAGTGGVGGGASSSSSTGSGSSAFVVLAQLSRMHLEVALSESDIADVEVGRQATVTVNAASGEEVAGKVVSIDVLAGASSSAGASSAVSYPVTIALTQTTKGLKAGMSATAEIVTGQAEGVVVPNQALQGGMVTVVKDGARSRRRVQTGVAGDASTQVVSGLSAGDRVVVTSPSAAAGAAASRSGGTSNATQNGVGRFGGGGGAGGLGGGFAGGGGPPGGGFPGGGGR